MLYPLLDLAQTADEKNEQIRATVVFIGRALNSFDKLGDLELQRDCPKPQGERALPFADLRSAVKLAFLRTS